MTAIGSEQTRLRDEICDIATSLFTRGFTHGSTGNISTRLSDGTMLMTPTGSSFGGLDPARLSHLAADGKLLGGDAPTKEAFLHTCMYCARKSAGSIVHVHSTHSVAVSILADIDPGDVLPPLTAYYVMRVGRLPLVPYFPPGDRALAKAVEEAGTRSHAVLLANHGPVVAGSNLREAQYALEELEETARIYLLLLGLKTRPLTEGQAAELRGDAPRPSPS